MKKAFKDCFTFSSRERAGMVVLLVLIILATAANLWLRYFPGRQKTYDYSGFNREMDYYRSSITLNEIVPEGHSYANGPLAIRPFLFDPNTVTKEELKRLGVDDRISGRIHAYRNKGGRFFSKEDLLKIYDFDTGLYATLFPFIDIKEDYKITGKVAIHDYMDFGPVHRIEINSSDSSGLKLLQGIGPVLASRIVRYRGLLGGYYSIDQLREVYGITDSLYLAVKEQVSIDTSLIRKIAVNKASEWQLSRHPYIGKYTAKAILSYRKSMGNINGIEELVKNRIIPEEEESRIRAYLLFSEQ